MCLLLERWLLTDAIRAGGHTAAGEGRQTDLLCRCTPFESVARVWPSGWGNRLGTFQERLAKLAGVGSASPLNKYRLYSALHDLQDPLNT